MQGQRSILDDLKHQFKHGGATIRLIFINVIIFLGITVFLVFGRLAGAEPSVQSYVDAVFTLDTSIKGFITHPWGLITSVFAHFSIMHILFNMVFLYFSGRIFEQLFDNRRLIHTYVLGGIGGGLFEILAHVLFPALQETSVVIVGASGSIMAIFFAIAFHQPKLKINLFGVLPVQMIILAAVFFLLDFINLGNNDGTAHFAHIGGAVIGMISIQGLQTSGNLITRSQNITDAVLSMFKSKRTRKMKVYKNPVRQQTDEEYNASKKNDQEEVNRILDKISKSGYESLTKKEKDFLFNQSQK